MNITTKQFQILTDTGLVWDFLTDIYDRETGSGVAAPVFEYALQSSWMDQSYSFLDRLWLDGDRAARIPFTKSSGTGRASTGRSGNGRSRGRKRRKSEVAQKKISPAKVDGKPKNPL